MLEEKAVPRPSPGMRRAKVAPRFRVQNRANQHACAKQDGRADSDSFARCDRTASHAEAWDYAFDVEFDGGLAFLEPHKTIRKANKIAIRASVQSVELDKELRRGFCVRYDNGQTAEVSWAFIRELPPKQAKK